MTLGEKIKKARLEQNLTQKKLCGDMITRNMLSRIECDKASPSLATLEYIASRLSLPTSYLFSDDDSTFFFEKKDSIDDIKNAFTQKDYEKCIKRILKLSTLDDETAYILSSCYFELGKRAVLNGSLTSGSEYIKKATSVANQTIYDTSRIKTLSLMYSAVAENIQSPLLEFDSNQFEDKLNFEYDYEFFRYLIRDYSYSYKNTLLANHVKAKEMMKLRKYNEAIALLREIENEKRERYNSYIVFGVYSDLETAYKQLGDYENAYRYANKKLSLLEGFKA